MGNPVVRFEIGCKNRPAVAKFYARAFGWKMRDSGLSSDVDTGAKKGVNGAVTALGHEPHNYVMVYMEVENADAACDKIKACGGKVAIGPVDIPGDKGRFAWFNDPEGNLLGIFQPPGQEA